MHRTDLLLLACAALAAAVASAPPLIDPLPRVTEPSTWSTPVTSDEFTITGLESEPGRHQP